MQISAPVIARHEAIQDYVRWTLDCHATLAKTYGQLPSLTLYFLLLYHTTKPLKIKGIIDIDMATIVCYHVGSEIMVWHFPEAHCEDTNMKTKDTEVVVFTRSASLPKLYIKTTNGAGWFPVKVIFNFRGNIYQGREICSGFRISFGNAVVEVTKDTVLSEKDPMLN